MISQDAYVSMKRCSKCGEVKALEEFSPNAFGADGRRSECKRCGSAAAAKRRSESPEKAREAAAKYRAENPEKERSRRKKYCAELPSGYVAGVLRMKVSEVPNELLELKRAQLEMKRLTKQLTKEIENA